MPSANPVFPKDGVWSGISKDRVSIGQDTHSFEDIHSLIAEVRSLQNMMIWTADNANASTLEKGAPLYIKSDGDCDLADADGSGTRFAIGLALEATLTTAAAKIQVGGIMELTAAEWDVAAGTTGGLDEGVDYYVSDTVGKLTATAPATSTDTLMVAGIGLSPTKLLVQMTSELAAVV